jgi:hypothetical protein
MRLPYGESGLSARHVDFLTILLTDPVTAIRRRTRDDLRNPGREPRMKWPYFAALALAGAALTLANARPASAAGTPLSICNQSAAHINVATGYHSSGVNDMPNSNILSGPFVSDGWTRIEPGECSTFANPFGARYMFWWAFSPASGLNAVSAWATNGVDHFCIAGIHVPAPHAFTFEDENRSQTTCESTSTGDGPNVWVSVRAVDLMVNSTVYFTGQ